MLRRWSWLLSLIVLSTLLPRAAHGAEHDKPELAQQLASPRATMRTFIEAMNENRKAAAAKCLDLNGLDQATAAAKASDYAYRLKEIIDRMGRVRYEELPNDADATEPYQFATSVSGLSAADLEDARKISIVRGEDGLWRFSSETVAAIDDVWRKWQDRPEVPGLVASQAQESFQVWLERQFPASLRGVRLLLPDYQWLCLLAVIFLGLVADLFTRLTLNWLTAAWLRFVRADVDREARVGLWKPVGLMMQALVWYGGTSLIGLPAPVLSILLVAVRLFAVVAAVWTAFHLVDLLTNYLRNKAAGTETKFDDLLIPLVSKSLKALTVCVGVVLMADMFNLDYMGLLGGLGIGGLAIGFAAKDVLGNFFGSLTVLTDRPFEIGDSIKMENVEGIVESVGIRSTRVRTFYNSQVIVPNALLTTAVVDNMGRRRYRRIKTMLGVQYDTTPEQIDAFCEGVRELIRQNPVTRKDHYHVYFNEYADSSLNILLYCFLECPDYATELREKHRLYSDILKLAQELKVSFAFPTRTVHLFQEEQQPAEAEDATTG